MNGLEAKYNGQVNFISLDIDDSRTDQFKQALGYRYQPHIFLVDGDGNILSQWVGFVAEQDLEGAITDAIAR